MNVQKMGFSNNSHIPPQECLQQVHSRHPPLDGRVDARILFARIDMSYYRATREHLIGSWPQKRSFPQKDCVKARRPLGKPPCVLPRITQRFDTRSRRPFRISLEVVRKKLGSASNHPEEESHRPLLQSGRCTNM